MKKTYPTILLIVLSCLLMPNIVFSQSGQSPSGHVPCVEITGRTSNFAPSLGESASISVKITPPPPSGGYPGYYFQCEIVRVTQNCTTQHIKWVDTIPGTADVDVNREVDFHTLTMVWDGVAETSVGQSTGIGYFQGVSGGTQRLFPPIVSGECVPPPFCTIVVRIRKKTDHSIVCQDIKNICVKQVVVIDFTAAESVMKQGLYRDDNITIINPLSDNQYSMLKAEILIRMHQCYGGLVNIEFIEGFLVDQPYSKLSFETGTSGGDWGEALACDFCNIDPKDDAFVYTHSIRQCIRHDFSVSPDDHIPPITMSEQVTVYSRTATHEIGHLLGLTMENDVLNGTSCSHNQPLYSQLYLMNPGSAHSVRSRIGRNGSWSFSDMNQVYLKWILPKSVGDHDEICN